jgi:hypothetical protein
VSDPRPRRAPWEADQFIGWARAGAGLDMPPRTAAGRAMRIPGRLRAIGSS